VCYAIPLTIPFAYWPYREHGKFDSTQLKALKEYLPDAEERRGLVAYMKRGEKSIEEKAKVYADLSETEKYMVTMMEVKEAAAKFDALQFRTIFKSRFEDITSAIRTLNSACDEVRISERLRKLMAMILTVVNQINTGGEGNVALGFSLDALLKLNEVSFSVFITSPLCDDILMLLHDCHRQKRSTGKLASCTIW
jgi:hypothetical protein